MVITEDKSIARLCGMIEGITNAMDYTIAIGNYSAISLKEQTNDIRQCIDAIF